MSQKGVKVLGYRRKVLRWECRTALWSVFELPHAQVVIVQRKARTSNHSSVGLKFVWHHWARCLGVARPKGQGERDFSLLGLHWNQFDLLLILLFQIRGKLNSESKQYLLVLFLNTIDWCDFIVRRSSVQTSTQHWLASDVTRVTNSSYMFTNIKTYAIWDYFHF